MSKLDNNVIDTIKILSLDMIKEAGSGDSGLVLGTANIFYSLFANYLNFNPGDDEWVNRDRLVVSNRFLPLMYSSLHIFLNKINLDNLKEYKKYNSITSGYANPVTPGIEAGSTTSGDVISSAVGIALGERYLNGLIKDNSPKCELLNFNTYCICTMDDLMSGLGYESLSFAGVQKLNKLIILCNRDNIGDDGSNKEIYNEDLEEKMEALGFEFIEIKNGHNNSAINDAIDEAKHNKRPTIIVFNTKYGKDSYLEEKEQIKNLPLSNDEISELSAKYKINYPITNTDDIKSQIYKQIEKRLTKVISKWKDLKNEYVSDLKIKNIIEFLETKDINIDFQSDKFKMNDNYKEELIIGNSKMFNMFAMKSPYILSLSNDNFINSKCKITDSDYMNKDKCIAKNISFGKKTLAMGGIANGLASLGFKVFVSAPLIDSMSLLNAIKSSSIFNYSVNYIFTQDSLINDYNNMGLISIPEINMLRSIPNLIVFRPCDINEIIGTYEILSNYKKSTIMIVGTEKTEKFVGTNPKYVVAGAYRVRRERGEATGIIIATGTEVKLALDIAEELYLNGIDLRVITMPSKELFELQKERYKYTLIPKELKTFVIEFGNGDILQKYATAGDYVFEVKNYTTGGTKEELLNYYNLTKDKIKAQIIEIIKK